MLFDDTTGEVRTAAGRWHERQRPDDINTLEATAVALAWAELSDGFPANPNVLILVDNTSVMHTLRKGRAAEFHLNRMVDMVLSGLKGNGNVRIAYINTLMNPADRVSRGMPLDWQLASSLGAVGRREEQAAYHVAAPIYPNVQQKQVRARP